MSVISKVKSIISKALDRYAKTYGLEKNEMQILILMKGKDDIIYFLLRKYQTEQQITFMEILGYKIDMTGISLMAPKFIRSAMERMCTDFGVHGNDLRVIISKNVKNEIEIFAYKNQERIEQISFDYLFMEN